MLNFLKNFIQNTFFIRKFQVYTDGSYKKGWGSWAFVIIKNNKMIYESSGRKKQATSNQMEFQAAINAICFLPEKSQIEIFTDSKILINAVNKIKRPLVYQREIAELENLSHQRKITWFWVKAHSGVRFNERCDELCIQAREGSLL